MQSNMYTSYTNKCQCVQQQWAPGQQLYNMATLYIQTAAATVLQTHFCPEWLLVPTLS